MNENLDSLKFNRYRAKSNLVNILQSYSDITISVHNRVKNHLHIGFVKASLEQFGWKLYYQ